MAAILIPPTNPELDNPARAKASRPSPSAPDYSAARAFARVGWWKVWTRLLRYATGTLRLAAIDAETAGIVEAADLAAMLVEKALGGTLGWTLPGDASENEVLALAYAKLYGMRWTVYRQSARTAHDDALDEWPDPGPDALARLLAKRGGTDLEGAFQHDAEASIYLGEMLKGETREDIMHTLGWPVVRANTVYTRIMRRVAALARRANDDGEHGPASSDPTPPGPHRGAPGADRRVRSKKPAARATPAGQGRGKDRSCARSEDAEGG